MDRLDAFVFSLIHVYLTPFPVWVNQLRLFLRLNVVKLVSRNPIFPSFSVHWQARTKIVGLP